MPIEPVTMVDSGLFYSGNGDYVTCFYCGTGFSDWESDDVPNIEHIKFYPDCPFMNLMFDRQYIDKISNVASSKQKETSTKFEDPMTHSTVLSCIETGFDEKLVKITINRFYEIYQHMNFDSTSFTEILFNLEEEEEANYTLTFGSTNETVKSEPEAQLFSCAICLDEVSNLIIFWPCGHMKTCIMCCVSVDLCPVCRERIKGKIRPKFK